MKCKTAISGVSLKIIISNIICITISRGPNLSMFLSKMEKSADMSLPKWMTNQIQNLMSPMVILHPFLYLGLIADWALQIN